MTVELRTSEAKTIYMLTEIAIGDTFNIPFKYLDFDENISVGIRTQVDDDSNDSFKELTLDTDYYIMSSDGTNGIWGVVTFLTAYSGLQSLVIYRDIPVSQDKTFNSQTKFSATTEAALDKLTMIAQDNVFENRILRAPIDDTVSDSGLELPIGEEGYFYTNESGEIEIRSLEAAQKSLRQPDSETEDESFVISAEERAGNILAFNAETAKVDFIPKYTAGNNVQISDQNVISATDTTYTAGDNVDITNNVISATDTTYTAGDNVDITNNVISATDTTYTAGANVDITNNVISATDTTYTAGDNVDITNNVISATDTTYTAGTNVQISGQNVISATDTTYTAGTNITIDENNKISAVHPEFTAGENIIIDDNIISADIWSVKVFSILKWESTTMPSDTKKWRSVCYGNGRFVAVADSVPVAAYSEDGINWTAARTPPSDSQYGNHWYSVCYGNGRFVAVAYGSNAVAYSEDGIDWYTNTMPSVQYWSSLCFGNGKFVALCSALSAAAYSEYGISWTAAATPPSTANWNSVCYGVDKFVAVAANSSSRYIAYSADGNVWTTVTNALPANAAWNCVCYGNGRFVTIASGRGVYSEDGVTWYSATTAPSSIIWNSVCYGNGKFVAVGESGRITYSTDGNTWTTPNNTILPTASWKSICCGNGEFVAVSNNSTYNYAAYTPTTTIAELIQEKIGG